MKCTLREWQNTEKPRYELLYNCSEYDKLNDEWVPFSIGMCYHIINYTEPLRNTQIGNHEQLVFCAVSTYTDSRRRGHLPVNRTTILNTLNRNGMTNTNVAPLQYYNILPHYKFVISPEGNGIDCHRHYEALMAGCIPIVEDHPGIREKYAGCPVLFTKDYSEMSNEYLEKTYSEMIDKEYDFSKLLLSSYSNEDRNAIKDNGNYWSYRLTHRRWYE